MGVVGRDPYRWLAPRYDRLAKFNEPLVRIAVDRCPPDRYPRVLDVGCGTGAMAGPYLEGGAEVTGIDGSPSMLEQARANHGDRATWVEGDARSMPFDAGSFDLAVAMMMIHEIAEADRDAVVTEMARVVAPGGAVLIIDHHAGGLVFPKGWLRRVPVTAAELIAGPRHFGRYLGFLRSGGVPALASRLGLSVERQKVVGGGSFGFYEIGA
jgi:ubiquinone/menaquinone biosynthesis C-methylase UbiE